MSFKRGNDISYSCIYCPFKDCNTSYSIQYKSPKCKIVKLKKKMFTLHLTKNHEISKKEAISYVNESFDASYFTGGKREEINKNIISSISHIN